MRRLEIKDFKCIKDDEIEFLDLTVLAGNNGAGKSTVIQTMLIMLQSFNKKESILLPKNYYINDYYCELGNTSKLLLKESNEDSITFKFIDEFDGYTKLELGIDKMDTNSFYLKDLDDVTGKSPDGFNKSLSFLKYLDFIGADRYGPKIFHHTDSNFARINVGKYGEYSTLVLHKYQDKFIKFPLPTEKNKSTLLTQVNFWLKIIFDNIEVKTSFIDEANIAMLYINNRPIKNFQSPVNMPYGVSYVLPIIVSCLVRSIENNELGLPIDDDSKKTVIIENPEAHLHPSAQSKLGYFLGYMANEVQIIIETHSDHIINGIRKAVKFGKIAPDKVIFNFFKIEGEYSIINPIEINKDGDLSEWPDGFFDQFEKDVMELL